MQVTRAQTVCGMRWLAVGACSLVAVSLCLQAHAGDPSFTITAVIKDGDSFPPYGTVSNINDISVNNNGEWLVDASLTGGTSARALIKNGVVWLAQGDTLPPNDNPVSSVANLLKDLNIHGDVAFRPTLSNAPTSGIYLNMTPLILVGGISTAPQFSPNTPYTGFFRARVNDSRQLLAITSVDDPAIATTTDRALVWLTYNEKTQTVTESVLYKEADPAPDTETGTVFSDFSTNADEFSINNNGDAMFQGDLTGPSIVTANNGGLFINDRLVVRKGSSSPIKGTTYNGISSSRSHMNINREFVFTSTITPAATGTGTVIGRGSYDTPGVTTVFRRQGDAAPGLTETVSSFGTGTAPQITDAGDVVWYAQLSGETTQNQALFRNGQLLIRKGVTMIDASPVTTVLGTTSTSNGIGSTLVASPNGQYVLIRSVLNAGPRAALLIEFDLAEPCPADTDGSGAVDVDDLIAVILGWGPCPTPPDPCDADTDGSGAVDVDDLIAVILGWGPCP